MPKGWPSLQCAALSYPSHRFAPTETLSFIVLDPFTRQWDKLALDEKDLLALRTILMTDPHSNPAIEGTGGVRKCRFVPPKWAKGKRGGLRVYYACFEEVGVIVLAFVYGTSKSDNLTEKKKAVLKVIVARVRRRLLSRLYRCKRKSGKPEPEG